jgi:hypothetical protein
MPACLAGVHAVLQEKYIRLLSILAGALCRHRHRQQRGRERYNQDDLFHSTPPLVGTEGETISEFAPDDGYRLASVSFASYQCGRGSHRLICLRVYA